MLLTLAIILLILWLAGFLAFHVTAWFIHLLIVVAIILFILHFVRGSAAPRV
ncbi:MAG: lmo0937 family membrane protein [Acidobacteria bacterium]|nr:lmo0937 family membrane protein [Acidobacteriota bacterium]MBV9477743.1 lmo0937 family membrane protein [Acidobacteriota bacterium]